MRWHKRVIRAAQKLDALAEVVVFNLLFGTRTGRRLMLASAASIALAVYLAGGWLFTPAPLVVPEPQTGMPYFDASAWPGVSEELRVMIHHGSIEPIDYPYDQIRLNRPVRRVDPRAHAAALEKELDALRPVLDRVVQLTSGTAFIRFAGSPARRQCSELSMALVARGVWMAHHGNPGAAAEQWIAAARFGRATGWGDADAKGIFDALVTTGIERRAYEAIRRELVARPSLAIAFAVRRDWQRRHQGEVKLVARIPEWEVQTAGVQLSRLAHGETTASDISGLRWLMPIRERERDAFVRDTMQVVRRSYDRMFDHWWTDPKRSHDQVLASETCARCVGGQSRLPHASMLLSRESAVRHAALALVNRNMDVVFEQLATRNKLLNECRKLANEALLTDVD